METAQPKKIGSFTCVIEFKGTGPGNQGDHIDLWNGRRLTKFSSLFEFSVRSGRHYSDADVWFWPVS